MVLAIERVYGGTEGVTLGRREQQVWSCMGVLWFFDRLSWIANAWDNCAWTKGDYPDWDNYARTSRSTHQVWGWSPCALK